MVPLGLAYGVAVYYFMDIVVLPLSHVPNDGSSEPTWRIVGSVIGHAFLVGLPIAFFARRNFPKSPESTTVFASSRYYAGPSQLRKPMSLIKLISAVVFVVGYIVLVGMGIQHAKADDGQFRNSFLAQIPWGGISGLLIGSNLNDWQRSSGESDQRRALNSCTRKDFWEYTS